jgi:aryl-alcohol dehydrogenase-like predicted oxidoreductase
MKMKINNTSKITRRNFLRGFCMMTAGMAFMPVTAYGQNRKPITRTIPSSGERIPVIGMGTSRTFDVGDDPLARRQLQEVLQAFFDNGGTLIDSSPMYGNAEEVVGELLKNTRRKDALFAATKVWTDGRQAGIEQMQRSMQRLGVPIMDLMQIHNLRDWKVHLPTLRQWKAEGKIRYIGITTSHGRSHADLEQIMRNEALDFVQFTYNIGNRTVEENLLPLAADRGMATLINRPYQRGALFKKVKGQSLPEWVKEFDCRSWGNFFLKFILSHPAVTCIIPATSKVHHMQDNMAGGFGKLPTPEMRRRMVSYMELI